MDIRTLRSLFASSSPPRDFATPLQIVSQGAFRLEGVLRAFYVFPIFWFCTHLHELRPLLAPQGIEL
ncbi:MAG: hypothetical protein AAF449_20215, partial [Myxococcota bacterium]